MAAQRYKGYLIEVDEDEDGWWWQIYDDHGDSPEDDENYCFEPLDDEQAAIDDAEIVIDELKGG